MMNVDFDSGLVFLKRVRISIPRYGISRGSAGIVLRPRLFRGGENLGGTQMVARLFDMRLWFLFWIIVLIIEKMW